MQSIYPNPGTFTWVCPGDVTSVDTVDVWAPGGNGSSNGGGGGGGGFSRDGNVSVTPGSSYTVTVAAGGSGGVSSFVGNAGATTSAVGGSNATSSSGAVGGPASSGQGAFRNSGGTGGTSDLMINAGGGGGGAGDGDDGSSGTAPTGGVGGTPGGGAGGDGGNTLTNNNGTAGTAPGGGGGGGIAGGTGASGASGKVVLSYTTSLLPPSWQPSQRVDALPDDNQVWWNIRRTTTVTGFVPPPPQKRLVPPWFELPHANDVWWRQHKTWPLPVAYIPTPPPTHQQSQVIVTLPDFWQEYTAYRQSPYSQWYVPPRPPTRMLSQRFDALPVEDSIWYQQHRLQPVPVSFFPIRSLPHQPSQRFDEIPDLIFIYWEQFRKVPLPSSVLTSQEGAWGVYNLVIAAQLGAFRAQNNIEGYNVYVGIDALPDLTGTPVFSPTLPVSIAVVPPSSGIRTFYVLVTAQDTYGLNSTNQFFTTISIDSAGNLILPPISAPQMIRLDQQPGGMIRVMSIYRSALTDPYPADTWKVWAGVALPNPLTDAPVAVLPVQGTSFTTTIGPYAPGTYYGLVALYRTADNALSASVYATVVVSPLPDEVTAVPSGYDQP